MNWIRTLMESRQPNFHLTLFFSMFFVHAFLPYGFALGRAIYIVYGERVGAPGTWENRDFSPMTQSQYIRHFTSELFSQWRGEQTLYPKTKLSHYNMIRTQFKTMMRKGYRLSFVEEVDPTDLLRIMSQDDTVAIFYSGHTMSFEDENGECEAYLSTRARGETFPLNADTVATARQKLGYPFQPGPNLSLFYAGSCRQALCAPTTRALLGLPDKVLYLFPTSRVDGRPIDRVCTEDVALSFENSVARWVDELEPLSTRDECLAELLFH